MSDDAPNAAETPSTAPKDTVPKADKGKSLGAGKSATWWTKEVNRSFKSWSTYRTKATKVIERYRDEREAPEDKKKRFNILFSNVETLKPAIYSQAPMADIRRRWQDKDPVGRLVAQILQRSVTYCLESYDFNGLLKRCNLDYLLPGFAVARVVYKPYLKGEGQDAEKIYEEVGTKYVPWSMFAMSRSKTYENVWWAATAEDLTKDEVRAQFGDKIAEALSYERRDDGQEKTEVEADGKVRVWEVWCKRDRSRLVVVEGYQEFVRPPESDPLRLENFFPWPKPLWSVMANDTLEPTPEYTLYQDQALELDDLTQRIDVLTSALRRRGVYDAQFKEMLGMLTGKDDNQFVAVNDFAALMQKGGLEKVAMEMPIDSLVATIVQLEDRREKVKQIIYEVTGIADIVRGASNPNETLGAQQLKGRWAGLRISTRQQEFAQFARDIIRLKAEIIAERFSPETLGLMSGIELPTAQAKQAWQQMQTQQQQQQQMWQQVAQQAQQRGVPPPPQPPMQPPKPEEVQFYQQPTWEDVMQVLRSDKLRGFKIDIETDSTVQPDADAEKQARTELLTGIGQFSQAMSVAIQAGVMTPDLAQKLIQWALRSFKMGASVEEELEGMGQAQALSPAMQQAQKQQQEQAQQMEKQGQELQKREAAAKDAEHQQQLSAKDLERKHSEVKAAEDLLALKQQFADELKAIHGKHAEELMKLVTQAEDIVRQMATEHAETQATPETPQAEAQEPLPALEGA
jgi:hypothetical protein